MARFWLVKTKHDALDSYAGESLAEALDLAGFDDGTAIEWGSVEAEDAGMARLVDRHHWQARRGGIAPLSDRTIALYDPESHGFSGSVNAPKSLLTLPGDKAPRLGSVDDEDAEPSEPSEGDLTTEDHIHFYSVGASRRGPVLTMQESKPIREGGGHRDATEPLSDAAMWKQLDAYMKNTNFYPNVWWISDHGNTNLLARPSRKRR